MKEYQVKFRVVSDLELIEPTPANSPAEAIAIETARAELHGWFNGLTINLKPFGVFKHLEVVVDQGIDVQVEELDDWKT